MERHIEQQTLVAPSRALQLRDRLRSMRLALPDAGLMDLRPLWRGRAFERHAVEPMTACRAYALAAVLDEMALLIRPEERIVGAPMGVLSATSMVDEATMAHYARLDAEAGERGFLTNADHLAPDYAHLLAVGFPGLLAEIRASLAQHHDERRRAFLHSVEIALEAVCRFARRWAAACRAEAESQPPPRAAEMAAMADDLDILTVAPPATLAQALQLVWLVHLIYAIEGRGAMAFGRMDQYLLPFYRRAVAAGQEAEARALFECFWAKLEEPLLPNPVQNIAIGGQTPKGDDAVNELSYLLLQVTGAVGTPHSNLSARCCARTPQAFYDACIALIKTGIGFPALFNDEVLVPAIIKMGVPVEEARDYAFVGCIETFLPGRMPPWSDSRVNLLVGVDRTLRRGRDGLDGEQRGPITPALEGLATFDQFMGAFEAQVRYMVCAHCADIAQRKRALDSWQHTSPLLSALVADCIVRGLDINMGGARYPAWHGPCGMGLGSTADALAAIQRLVYDQKALGWDDLLAALDADFRGHEALRQRLLRRAFKYGNDHPVVDDLAARVVRVFTDEVLAQRMEDGGRFVPLMAANVANIAAGKEVGATPDGRRAGEPVSDAASPSFGRDRQGPTAVIRSLCAVDYTPVVGGTVVNQRFSPHMLRGPAGTALLRSLVQTYFAHGGMQMQFNVTGGETLRAAMEDPAAYSDLLVRVSGFSALYVGLSREVQEDILARTEHGWEEMAWSD
jgi:pyruvate formate-lyase/glycerol dehydratase family glycyl radical enzyme